MNKLKVDLKENQLVGDGLDFIVFDPMKEGSEDTPSFGQLIRSHEMHLGSAKNVQDETLVSVWHLHVLLQLKNEQK